MAPWVRILILLAALGSGLVAGTFFAFSTFVMKALSRLPGPQGIAAMQSINVVVLNPAFLGVFTGTALACAVLGVRGCLRWSEPGAPLVVVAGALYVVGTFAVTMACNVPLNDMLAAMKPDVPTASEEWRGYAEPWTAWNHVRTVAALAALGLFIGALASGRPE